MNKHHQISPKVFLPVSFTFFIILFIFFCSLASVVDCQSINRTFEIDYQNNQFLKDGKPFRYVSGTMHYFRVPRSYWKDRLQKMKFGGLNAIQTYVEWSSHEPQPGQYDFQGQLDLIEFIQMAHQENLLVILRAGPYICAERDMGGFPYWLLKTPGIQLRTSDPKYIKPVDNWLNILLPKIKPLLYKNGGPIIMVQIENEYGSYGCDLNYTTHLRDRFHEILGQDVVLFTTDGNGDGYLRCGKVPGVLSTIDFGASANVSAAIATLRRHQEFGPFINSEFYSGWLDLWESQFITVETKQITNTLEQLLENNASVNIYVYHGGTDFGFKSAALILNNVYKPTLTSYDYDAPINEAGDLTDKFYGIKNVIEKFLPPSEHQKQPQRFTQKMSLPPVSMLFAGTIFDHLPQQFIKSKDPIAFEDANLAHGFLLYQTNITFHPTSPAVLFIPGLRDRAHVFVNRKFAGILSRTQHFYNLSILAHNGSELAILVENQGRCSYQCFDEKKGIIGLVKINQHIIQNWHIYRMFDDWDDLVNRLKPMPEKVSNHRIPSFFIGNFTVPNTSNYPLDSFLQVNGWAKGVAFLNGFNLGRYWPVAGPQITLYTPSMLFNKPGDQNHVVLFELDDSPCWHYDQTNCQMQFVNKHIINGPIPN